MNIEKYLVLNNYLLSLFGASEFKDLQKDLAEKSVGYDSEERSYFINVLKSLDGLKRNILPEEKLLGYDENIRDYLKKINTRREPKVLLKYFQYLAVLFTEIYLDELKNRKPELLASLNMFLTEYGREHDLGGWISEFIEGDLSKIAFWMATGSGKTLLLHINYHQFLRYKIFSPDNMILITPNEGLSKQHCEELQKSGVPCRLYGGSLSDISGHLREEGILIIEMTKLVEEKKGGGVTIPVEVFEGKNLLFVDEGHKGKKSEEQKWAKLRNKLADKGFVFEYSATFGQILSEANTQTLEEYGKAIILDYSYKYFYLDGHGKDFSVLNVRPGGIGTEQFQETMFIANLLAFYQQIRVYEEHTAIARQHNLEKPLWIFVGTTVNEEESDILQILILFHKALHDEEWLQEGMVDILNGQSGLKNEDGADAFEKEFDYLKNVPLKTDDVYRRIFGGKGNFSVHEIRSADGELALKVGESPYFGVVNIGSVTKVKKELEARGITLEVDAVSASLFNTIKRDSSTISVLIGSKKFIEGWDTWRVSSMGLLNIGTGQGPQIIQLFGRGIRIKGKGYSLKRSGETGPVRFLENLNVFGIRANYLSRFLEAIKKEDVEFETIEIPIKIQHESKWQQLYYLSKDESKRFLDDVVVPLEVDKEVFVSLDLSPKVMMFVGRDRKSEELMDIQQIRFTADYRRMPEGIIELLNWTRIMSELSEFKAVRGFWNLIYSEKRLKDILASDRYKLFVPEEFLTVKTPGDLDRLEDITIQVLKKYTERFYLKHAKRYESQNMRYERMKRQEALFVFDRGGSKYEYIVSINKNEQKLIKEIRQLVKDIAKLCQSDGKELPRVYFDRHLFVPILLQNKKIDKISPSGLVESETHFVTHLRQYLKEHREHFSAHEIYLLRNYPKSGVGFFNLSGFYPDFIMWVVGKGIQNMVFLDPKGLEHSKSLDDEKIKLHQEIKELEKGLGKKNIFLDSFILSKTTYSDVVKGGTEPEPVEEFEKNHVLFLEDQGWPGKLFGAIMGAKKDEVI